MALISFTCPLSALGFSNTKNTADDGLFDEVNKLNPDIAVTNLAAGNALTASSACFNTFVVPSNDVPDGVDTDTAIKPWSSVGIKAEGVLFVYQTVARYTSTNATMATHLRRKRNCTLLL